MQNISGYGLSAWLLASNTFPVGFPITEWADDADPVDFPELKIADSGMGLNGDLVTWTSANPILMTLNVIPDSQSDISLQIILEANRAAKGKSPARDIITLTLTYPARTPIVLYKGVITDGPPTNSVANQGRFKSKAYNFAFESRVGG